MVANRCRDLLSEKEAAKGSFSHAGWPVRRSGWPDEFVKKSPKILPNPFFVKINAEHLLW
jgi:hypothetical protein